MSDLQDMLRVQARLHREQGANALGDLFENAAKEINQYESALKEWIEKTEWVQNSANANELGVHRADALSLRISDLKSQLAKANERVKSLEQTNLELAANVESCCELVDMDMGAAIERLFEIDNTESKALLNKFAIEKKVEMVEEIINDCQSSSLDGVILFGGVKAKLEQLRKEQDSE